MKTFLTSLLLFTTFICKAQSKNELKILEKWIEKATKDANKGNIDSMKALAKFYYVYNLNNYGLNDVHNWLRSETKSVEWLRKCDAAGDAQCSFEMGALFIPGYGVQLPIDLDSAIYYFKKAAALGHSGAMFKIGWIYQSRTKDPDMVSAKAWFQKSADKGFQDAIDKLKVLKTAEDNLLQKGDEAFKAKNFKQALEYWKIDAEENFNIVSMYNVGVIVYNGYADSIPRKTSGRYYFEQSGKLGYKNGSYWAGLSWLNDEGGKIEALTKSKEWLQLAVSQGLTTATDAIAKVDAAIQKENKRIHEEEMAVTQLRLDKEKQLSDQRAAENKSNPFSIQSNSYNNSNSAKSRQLKLKSSILALNATAGVQ